MQQPTQPPAENEPRAETYPPQPPRYEHRPPATLAEDPLRRSPVLASVLALVPGLGQVYTGYVRLGFIHAIVVATLISFMAASVEGALIPLAALFLAFFWLYGIVDAGRRAVLVNQALLGRLDVDLPEALSNPKLRGSLPGGVAVMALGALLLANTLFDVSLRWVEDWWPIVVIGFGAFLIYRSVQDRLVGQGSRGGQGTTAEESAGEEL